MSDFVLSPFMGLLSLDAPELYALVLDFETTGLEAHVHGLWEIGAVLVKITFDSQKPVAKIEELSSFASPITPHRGAMIDIEAARYNGYRSCSGMENAAKLPPRGRDSEEGKILLELNAWLSDCKTLLEVKSYEEKLPGVPRVSVWAHNASFEEKFLAAWQARTKLKLDAIPSRTIYCTRQFFNVLKALGIADPEQSASLKTLCTYYGLDAKECTGLGDARRQAQVLAEEIITLRAAMGIYQAAQELSGLSIGVLTSTHALSGACSILGPTLEIMASMRAHLMFKRRKRSLALMLCRDMTTKESEIRLVLRTPDAVSQRASVDERIPLVDADPRYQPLILCSYSCGRDLYIVRCQTKSHVQPVLVRLVEILEAYLAEALAKTDTDTQANVNLEQMLIAGLPEHDFVSPDAGAMLTVAQRSRLVRRGDKTQKAIEARL